MKQNARLILATQSASRKQLLEGAGLSFETLPAHIDESALRARLEEKEGSPTHIAIALAQAKALKIAADHSQAYIIGADQILEQDGVIFEKPGDLAGAREQLRALRGHTHKLHSAICVARDNQILWSHVETAHMSMRDFDDGFLEDYLSASDPSIVDCVGSYQLESLGAHLFDHIEGDYFTVLGLPLLALLAFMRKISLIN